MIKVIEIHEGIVYVYTNTINGKQYVGETTQEDKRKWEHLYTATVNVNKAKTSKFYRAIRKYGYDKFTYEVLYKFESTDKDLVKETIRLKEIEYIELFDTYKNGYNSTIGGGGAGFVKHTDEAKKKMSDFQKNRVRKPHSQETKDKIAQNNRIRVVSQETKDKISNSLKNRNKHEQRKDNKEISTN